MSPQNIITLWKKSTSKKAFEKILQQNGFRIIGCGSSALVFSSRGGKYVVKVSKKGGIPTKRFKNATLEKFRLGFLFVSPNRDMAIQKRVNCGKKTKYRAWQRIRDSVNADIDLYHYDIHQDNVGLLNGRPVIFDHA